MKPRRHTRRTSLAFLVDQHGGQSAVAAKLGKDKNQVYQWLLDSKNPQSRSISDRTASTIEEVFQLPSGWMDAPHEDVVSDSVFSNETPPKYIRVPQLDMPVAAGQGASVELEPEVVRWLDVAEAWAREHFPRAVERIRVLTVCGDSMVGAGIIDGDLLFVDTGTQSYDGDGNYVLQFRDGWQVKRLRANMISQQLEIVSMLAGREESQPVAPAQEHGMRIAGKVAAWWTLRKH